MPAYAPVFSLDQFGWAPFAAISSFVGQDTTDAGFAVDVWRPNQFGDVLDVTGKNIPNVFTGINVDVAVRNERALLHRISYHITLVGKIAFQIE